jgi:hypothetical protein
MVPAGNQSPTVQPVAIPYLNMYYCTCKHINSGESKLRVIVIKTTTTNVGKTIVDNSIIFTYVSKTIVGC